MTRIAFVFFCVAGFVAPALAEVVDSSASGFSIRIAADVDAAPAAVYRAIAQVGSWWNPDHTWSGSAANLSLDNRAGGCFCEKLPTGSVQHMVVVYIDGTKTLRLAGGLGPLQSLGVAGSLTFLVNPGTDGKTRLEVTYNVGGYVPGGLAQLAPVVDEVLRGQVERLGKYAVTGRPQ